MGKFIKLVAVATVISILTKKATEKVLDKLKNVGPKLLDDLSATFR